eukprot:TRINITY_DN9837_c0_g1_i1.p1 TRINITY_DN9837_c0_g1~~TRINITY_DN9837_c0_g1_i1.p1  ORF type:complete len:231 (-),score=87.41 TRINITY_DN9837_c0_g1_i1:128-820(-)
MEQRLSFQLRHAHLLLSVVAVAALVMALLFKHGNALQKMDSVWSLTFEHGKGLAMFAGIYKGLMELMERCDVLPPNLRALVAGGAAGRLVWARYTAVNYQIVLYLMSRVVVGGAMRLSRGLPAPLRRCSFEGVYPYLATACWAVVMHLFENDADVLHPSLGSSMEFIYHDCHCWEEFKAMLPLRQTCAIVAAYAAYALVTHLPGVRGGPGEGGGQCPRLKPPAACGEGVT